MAMQVNGMDVVARVSQPESVALPRREMEHRLRVALRERHTVDRPLVEAGGGRVVLGEGHFEGLIGSCGYPGRDSAEARIVPVKWWRGNPGRRTGATRVLDHDTHAVAAVIVSQISHDPHPRMAHLDDRRHAFGRADPEDRDRDRGWQWV